MNSSEAIDKVKVYYTDKIKAYGPVYKGVDWNSRESQELRFEQLLKVCDTNKRFSINDYGCGYGALVGYMIKKGYAFEYYGFDISEEMIARAKELYTDAGNCKFFSDELQLAPRDYTIASGLFNVKLDAGNDEWQEYVIEVLEQMNERSIKGFSFNMLTKYSDPGRMCPDLYYGDSCYFFDYCKRRFSKDVALLHDYRLYEFTVLVRNTV